MFFTAPIFTKFATIQHYVEIFQTKRHQKLVTKYGTCG